MELEPINAIPAHLLPGKMKDNLEKVGDILSLHTNVSRTFVCNKSYSAHFKTRNQCHQQQNKSPK